MGRFAIFTLPSRQTGISYQHSTKANLDGNRASARLGAGGYLIGSRRREDDGQRLYFV